MKKRSYYLDVRGVRAASGALLYEVRDFEAIGYIDVLEYARRPADALAELVRFGIICTGAKLTYLRDQIAQVEEFEDAPLFDRIGHNGPHFAYPSGEIISPAGAPAAQVIFDPKPDKSHQRGDLTGWLEGVATPLAGHAICEFFMMMPFAGPLLHFTSRVQNFGWELAGPKATGKSVLLQLMSSTCGGSLGGDEGNFGLSFIATSAGIEWQTQNYSDLIMIIDEGNLYELGASRAARGRAFSQLLMALGKGEEKRRYGESSRTFRFVFATSSNESLLEVIGGTGAQSVVEAVSDRLMTIPLAGREFGIFDRIPDGYKDTGDFIADVINASSQHHGVAMRHYLQNLVNLTFSDAETFKQRLESHVTEFRRQACVERNAGSARRVAEAFGMVYAAGRLAIHLDALPGAFDPLGSALECYRLHKAAFQAQPSPAERLIALLDDPDVIDLDRGPLPNISDKKLAKIKAFVRTNRQRIQELLILPGAIRAIIPNWNWVRRDDYDVARMFHRENDRHTVKRQIRANSPNDRVICIVPSRVSQRNS